jgi:predicted nucleic acid-binding protein
MAINDYLGFLLNDLDKGEAEAIFLTKELKATRLPTTQSKLA